MAITVAVVADHREESCRSARSHTPHWHVREAGAEVCIEWRGTVDSRVQLGIPNWKIRTEG